MMTDKSYTPLDQDFREFMDIAGVGVQFSEAQIKFYRNVFYAGAASSLGFVKNNPLYQGTLSDEIADHADRMEAEYNATA